MTAILAQPETMLTRHCAQHNVHTSPEHTVSYRDVRLADRAQWEEHLLQSKSSLRSGCTVRCSAHQGPSCCALQDIRMSCCLVSVRQNIGPKIACNSCHMRCTCVYCRAGRNQKLMTIISADVSVYIANTDLTGAAISVCKVSVSGYTTIKHPPLPRPGTLHVAGSGPESWPPCELKLMQVDVIANAYSWLNLTHYKPMWRSLKKGPGRSWNVCGAPRLWGERPGLAGTWQGEKAHLQLFLCSLADAKRDPMPHPVTLSLSCHTPDRVLMLLLLVAHCSRGCHQLHLLSLTQRFEGCPLLQSHAVASSQQLHASPLGQT
jgi:hypothetical protein